MIEKERQISGQPMQLSRLYICSSFACNWLNKCDNFPKHTKHSRSEKHESIILRQISQTVFQFLPQSNRFKLLLYYQQVLSCLNRIICSASAPLDSSKGLKMAAVIFGKPASRLYYMCCLVIFFFFLLTVLLSLFLSVCFSSLTDCSSLPQLPTDSWITMYQCSARNWLPDKIMFCLILGYCSVMRANRV